MNRQDAMRAKTRQEPRATSSPVQGTAGALWRTWRLGGCLLLLSIGYPVHAAEPAKLSFGAPKAVEKGKSFGDARGEAATGRARSSERDRSYARGLLTKYDTDGDRVLTEGEWSKISGDPAKADTNGDKRITYDELVARVMQKRREKKATDAASSAGDRRTYRLRTAAEKLPEGLPGWFTQSDKNGDGQVAMNEYATRWTDATARRFVAMDKNDDGLITPGEAK